MKRMPVTCECGLEMIWIPKMPSIRVARRGRTYGGLKDPFEKDLQEMEARGEFDLPD